MSFDWPKIAGYCEDISADEKLALLDLQEEETQHPAEPEQDNPSPAQPKPELHPHQSLRCEKTPRY